MHLHIYIHAYIRTYIHTYVIKCGSNEHHISMVWLFCIYIFAGAFLIPYLIMLTLVGIPMLFMEFSFGQYIGLGPLTVWKTCPLFKGMSY